MKSDFFDKNLTILAKRSDIWPWSDKSDPLGGTGTSLSPKFEAKSGGQNRANTWLFFKTAKGSVLCRCIMMIKTYLKNFLVKVKKYSKTFPKLLNTSENWWKRRRIWEGFWWCTCVFFFGGTYRIDNLHVVSQMKLGQ